MRKSFRENTIAQITIRKWKDECIRSGQIYMINLLEKVQLIVCKVVTVLKIKPTT